MNSREAFAKYIAECDELAIVPDAAGAFNWAWQAAIQHARDVAVQKCEEHAFCEIDGHTERACHACADAIKEALK